MAKRRVIPYGFGKYIIDINMDELPEDIQEQIKSMYSDRLKDAKRLAFMGIVYDPEKEKK